MKVTLPKIKEANFEETLEHYFRGTKKAIDQAQEEFSRYMNKIKFKKISTRFRRKHVLQELLTWLAPSSNNNKIENDNRFIYLKDHFLITDLVYGRKGTCIAFTSLFVVLSRRMSIKVKAANVLISTIDEHLKYDLEGHICAVDKKKKHWDCIYLEGGNSCQHKNIQILTDRQLMALILSNHATNLVEVRNQEKKLSFLKQAIKLDSLNIIALLNLGAHYALNNFHPKYALEIYQKVVEIDPNHARAWCRIGEQYENLEKVNEAITSYERSISIKESQKPLFRLIMIYSEKKDYESAIDICAKFLKIEPNHIGIKEKCKKLKNISYN